MEKEQAKASLALVLNMDNNSPKEGEISYALNAVMESSSGDKYTLQNEEGNEFCFSFPEGFKVIGKKELIEKNRVYYWLTNPENNHAEIGYSEDCTYYTLINDKENKLNFSVFHPIHKIAVKSTNCSIQFYWTDGINPRRYLDLDDMPWEESVDPNNSFKKIKNVGVLDENKLLVQPLFSVPSIDVVLVDDDGVLEMGMYQFGIQYSNYESDAYTSVYGKSNPVSIFESKIGFKGQDINSSKAISLKINDLDTSGVYDYFNLIVIKTKNKVSTPYLIDTFPIDKPFFEYTYTGTSHKEYSITMSDVQEQFTYYDLAEKVFDVDNVLGWGVLTKEDYKNYQPIWNKVKVEWETYKLPYNDKEGYSNGVNVANYKGYMRDEVYALEGGFIKTNGELLPSFHIPGRVATPFDNEIININNKDVGETAFDPCSNKIEPKKRWEVYNTGSLKGHSDEYLSYISEHPSIMYSYEEEDCSQTQYYDLRLHMSRHCIDVYLNKPAEKDFEIYLAYVYKFKPPSPLAHNYIGALFGRDIFNDYPSQTPSDVLFPTNTNPLTPGLHYNLPIKLKIKKGDTFKTICNSAFWDSNTYEWGTIKAPLKENPNTTYIDSLNNIVPVTTGQFIIDINYIETGGKGLDVYVKGSPLVVISAITLTHSQQDFKDNTIYHPPVVIDINPCTTVIKNVELKNDSCYLGPYEYGDMAYWESTEKYPNNKLIWGDLADTPIRHHKFPDSLITHIHDRNIVNAKGWEHSVFPIGIKIDQESLYNAIETSSLSLKEKNDIAGFYIARGNRVNNKSVIAKGYFTNVGKYKTETGKERYYANYPYNSLQPDPFYSKEKLSKTLVTQIDNFKISVKRPGFEQKKALEGFGDHSRSRFTFYSPDTTFSSPSGISSGYVKMETIEYGKSYGNFEYVKDNAKYKFLTPEAMRAAMGLGGAAGVTIGAGTFGWPSFNVGSMLPAYTGMMDVFNKLMPYTNMGVAYHSFGQYGNYYPIPNNGDKIRGLNEGKYVSSGYQSIEKSKTLNHFQREKAVYINTTGDFRLPHEYDNTVPEDNSRFLSDSIGSLGKESVRDISAYYGSIKHNNTSQWGSMYSYETISTGYYSPIFMNLLDRPKRLPTVFGGDTFITESADKVKLPFYKNNTVNKEDGSGVEYDKMGTLGTPMFWLSTEPLDVYVDLDPQLSDFMDNLLGGDLGKIIGNFLTGATVGTIDAIMLYIKIFKGIAKKIGVKNINLHHPSSITLMETGVHYLFSYGVPRFFVESQVNTDCRFATNEKEGNFYKNYKKDIPDEWFQEVNVSIAHDNQYNYDSTYSLQNKLTKYLHLREDWDPTKKCLSSFNNRAIWSDKSNREEKKNNWLFYRPLSYFDFPKNFGSITAIDSIQDNAVLVRYENKAQLYNVLTTIDTSTGNAYLGNDKLFSSVPPLDLAHTQSGHSGSQHQMLVYTPYGMVYVDSLRGQVLLFSGKNPIPISGKGMSKWFQENLKFKNKDITDNAFIFNGITGEYDSFHNRLLITKKDFLPKEGVIYLPNEGYYYPINQTMQKINFADPQYFTDYSWTISYSFDEAVNAWTSFHSYTPNFYINNGKKLSTGKDGSGVWTHGSNYSLFNNYYGVLSPYILEYPLYFPREQIMQSLEDFSSTRKYTDFDVYFEPQDTIFFNKGFIYTDQSCSGMLHLIPRTNSFQRYPKYNPSSKEVLVTKTDNGFRINSITDLVTDKSSPFFEAPSTPSSPKTLKQSSFTYQQKFKEVPLREKMFKIRLILDDKNDTKIISQFLLTDTTQSQR